MKKYYLLSLSILLLLFLAGCVKDYFDTDKISTTMQWEPNIAAPLAKANLKIRDILQDNDHNELFEEDGTGFLYLVYRKKVYSAKAKDIIHLPDQSFPMSYTKSDVDAVGFNPNHIIKNNISYPFSVANAQLLDSIIIKYLEITINVQSSFHHTGTLIITFPGLVQNGTPFSTTIEINDASGTFSTTASFSDFNNYILDLTGLTGTDTNKVFINYDLTLYDSGSGTVNNGESCDITIDLQNLDYHTLFGYLGQDTLSIDIDTVHLEIYDHAFNGTAYFEDPHIYIYINNSYGLPLKMDFDDFSTFSTIDDSYASFPFPLSIIDIAAPSVNNIGTSELTTITLDTSNFPQLRNILDKSPKYLFFGVNGYLNPDGYSKNFATDSSHFDVDMEINLPLWGYASYLTLEDTTEADFSENFHDFDDIQWIKFLFNVDNGMPADVFYQVYFDDSTHVVLDSLFHNENEMHLVVSGILDNNYKVVASTHKTTTILYERPRLDLLENTKYVRFRGYIKTKNIEEAQLVKFYADYTINMKLGVQAQASINTSEYH